MRTRHRHSLVFLLLMCAAVSLRAQQPIQVQWATYLGGSDRDEARDVDCDDDDNAYVCGVFQSADFPRPRGVPCGIQDYLGPGYLAKFSPEGELLWLIWFRGFSPHEVAVSADGTAVVVGSADDGLNSLGGAQPGPGGTTDVGLVLVAPTGERLASTTIGGTRDDVGTSIDIDNDRIYVAGTTTSTDFPTTPNAPQRAYGGGGSLGQGIGDGVVAKYIVDRTGGTVQLVPDVASYYGGRYLDEILCIRRRNTLGEVYIGGRTRSDDLPGTTYISTGRSGDVFNDDGFMARLDSNLRPTWHMYVGGPGNDVLYSVQPRIEYDQSIFTSAVCVTACGVYNGGPLLTPVRSVPTPVDPPYAGGSQYGGDAFAFQTSGFLNVVRWLQVISTVDDDVCVALPRNLSLYGHPLVFSNGAVGAFNRSNGLDAYFWTTEYRGQRDLVLGYEGDADECILDADQQRFGFGGRALESGSQAEYFCGSTNSSVLPGTTAQDSSFQRNNRGGIDGYLVRTGCSNRRPKLVADDSVSCSAADSTRITFTYPTATAVWPDGSQGQTYVARGPGVVRVRYTTTNGCREYEDSVSIRAGVQPNGTLGPDEVVELCGASDSATIVLTGININTVQWSGGRPLGDTAIVVTTPGQYTATLTSIDGCVSTTNTVFVRNRSIDTTVRIEASIVTADSISPGSRFTVVLRLLAVPPTTAYPDSWTGTVRYNGTVLEPLFPISNTQTTGVEVQATTTAERTYGGDTLAMLPFLAALGETDTVSIVMDNITYTPCTGGPANVAIPISIAGICRANGIPRFITTRAARLSIIRVQGGTEQSPLEVSAAGTDVGMADAQLWTILGEFIPLQREAREGRTATWRTASPLPSGSYIVVVRTTRDVAHMPVSIVR
jgi:hypothetical protein